MKAPVLPHSSSAPKLTPKLTRLRTRLAAGVHTNCFEPAETIPRMPDPQ